MCFSAAASCENDRGSMNLASNTASSSFTKPSRVPFEWHYTPKHGSWLDMAESELAVLTTERISCRIPDKVTIEKEVAAWQSRRNEQHAKAACQFTTQNARVKLKRLYPQFE